MFSPTTSANRQLLSTVMMMVPFSGGGEEPPPQPSVPTAYGSASGTDCTQQQQHQQQSTRRSKKSRLDYANSLCTICNAPADGLHYGAVSCRSCNAFFRRSITYKQHFVCHKGGNCDVDVSVRCACRACRLAKCKLAGMRDTDVQPKRDPTGSQKNRRAPQRRRHVSVPGGTSTDGGTTLKTEMAAATPNVTDFSPNMLLPSVESTMEKHYTMPEVPTPCNRHQTLLSCPPSTAARNSCQLLVEDNQQQPHSTDSSASDNGAIQFIKSIKREATEDEQHQKEAEEGEKEKRYDGTDQCHHQQQQPIIDQPTSRPNSDQQQLLLIANPAADGIGTQNGQQAMLAAQQQEQHHLRATDQQQREQREFDDLVKNYQEHMQLMHKALTPIEMFLRSNKGECQKWRKMEPSDVDMLSKIELGGMMYWMDKLTPFRDLPTNERSILFKRYSVRKLTLDHAYVASKHPKLIADGNFAMLNNTYVPPGLTGFETMRDDERSRRAKYQLLRPTIDRQWHSLVVPFSTMRITDAEIVTLHVLLMWSASNNRFVAQESTRQMMCHRRDWAVQRLYMHYAANGVPEPGVRLGEILLFLPELEVICDLHCKDFHVAQLFEFDNMSDYWYENYAYSLVNIL